MDSSHPRICVGLVWYEDPSVFRTIDSIPEDWEIIIVDGRFEGSKAETEYSSEELRYKVKKYKNVTLIDFSGMEYQSRSVYFEHSEGFDILIVIDSDEWISYFDAELFYNYVKRLESGKHTINLVPKNSWIPRLFVDPSKWRYYKSHRNLKYDDGEIQNVSRGDSRVNGIEISTNEDLRSDKLKKTIQEYQDQLWIYETKEGIDDMM